jgi:hypothetical protein
MLQQAYVKLSGRKHALLLIMPNAPPNRLALHPTSSTSQQSSKQ